MKKRIPPRVKRAFGAFALPFAALGCLSAASTNVIPPGLSMKLGPFFWGESIPIHWEYKNTTNPNFDLQFTLYDSSSMRQTLYQTNLTSGRAYDTRYKGNYSIPFDVCYGYDRPYLVMTMHYWTDALFASKTTLNMRYTIEEFASTTSIVSPGPGQVVSTGRYMIVVEDQTSKRYEDTYYFHTYSESQVGGTYHGIRLDTFQIAYYGPVTPPNESGIGASLYVYTHPEDYRIGNLISSSSSSYCEIPLNVKKTYSYTNPNGELYEFFGAEAKYDYKVSRLDYSMHAPSESVTGAFLSRDIFLRSKTKYVGDTYRFRLRFYNLTERGDSVSIDFRVSKNGTQFGACSDSDYCIVLG